MNRFVDAHAPRGRVASRAPRRASLEPAPLPNRLRHVRVRAPCPRLNTPRNAPRLKDCRRPPDRPPQSQPTFVAGRRGGDFLDWLNAHNSTQSRADITCIRRRHSLFWRMPIASCDNSARPCAAVEAATLPRRLRRWTAHTSTCPATRARRKYRSHDLAALTDTPRGTRSSHATQTRTLPVPSTLNDD